jgi:hypothetical protein
MFHIFLALNRIAAGRTNLEVNKAINFVPLCKSFDQAVLVFEYAPPGRLASM